MKSLQELETVRVWAFRSMLERSNDQNLVTWVDYLNELHTAMRHAAKREGKTYKHDKMTVEKANRIIGLFRKNEAV